MQNWITCTRLLFILLVCLSCNTKQPDKQLNSDKLGLDTTTNMYYVTAEDTSMNSAIAKAKQTVAAFDQALKSNNASYTSFAVKKRYSTPDNGGEHMWVALIAPIKDAYKGFINNDAEKTTEVKYGDTVMVRKEEITDWMYLDKNVLRGGYTIRAVRNKLDKAERAKMDEELGFKIAD